MKRNISIFCIILLIVITGFGCDDNGSTSPSTDYPILVNGSLARNFGMGLDDAQQLRNWVSSTASSLKIQYPGGLDWGAVFITFGGDPVTPPRPSVDLSPYTKLVLEMKGASGNECVQIGMKDTDDPDDGSEAKQSVQLTADWNKYELTLSDFTTCLLSQVYIVTEFVFPCAGQNTAQTIEIRTIEFLM